MGSIVGALLAAGRLDAALEEILKADPLKYMQMLDPSMPGSAVLDGWKVYHLLRAWFGMAEIGDLDIPFCAVAADLSTGEEVVMAEGSLISAIRASISIPGIFPAWQREGRWLVDGGLVDPVPCGPVRAMGAEFVVAVDLNRSLPEPETRSARPGLGRQIHLDLAAGLRQSRPKRPAEPALMPVIMNSLRIAQGSISTLRAAVEPPDLLITPDLSDFSAAEFHRSEDLMNAGYEAAIGPLSALQGRL